MPSPPRSYVLTDLSWFDVAEHVAGDGRLIVPIGTCDQYGPHLPIGASTLIVEAVAEELARDFAVLRAPTLSYGVNLPAQRQFAGTAGLHEKSLHRVLNDLLASWEDDGFSEFILITAHRYEAHIDAIASVTGTRARVRAVEVLGMELTQFLDGPGGREHGGEAMTSLMLHLYPERVNLDRAVDFRPTNGAASPNQRLKRLPSDSPGSIGEPTLATAAKGELIYHHILRRIRAKVFLANEEDTEL